MKAVECATEAGEIAWKGWVEPVEDQTNGSKLVRIRGNNTEAILEIPSDLAASLSLTPQSVVETTSVARPGSVPLILEITVLNRAEPLPIDLKEPDFTDTRHRHLHIRTPQLRATAMFRHFLQKHVREYLDRLGFYHVQRAK